MSVELASGPFRVPSHIQGRLGLSGLRQKGVSQYDIGRGRVGHSFSWKYLAHPCRGTKCANRSPHQGGRTQLQTGGVKASVFRDLRKVESEFAKSAAGFSSICCISHVFKDTSSPSTLLSSRPACAATSKAQACQMPITTLRTLRLPHGSSLASPQQQSERQRPFLHSLEENLLDVAP